MLVHMHKYVVKEKEDKGVTKRGTVQFFVYKIDKGRKGVVF